MRGANLVLPFLLEIGDPHQAMLARTSRAMPCASGRR
jgi:hypothetical protein